MKIDYDVGLYKEIAQFPIDEIVQVYNRKGRKNTIHITCITRLTWQELQLLMPEGTDRFSKMVLLYQKYANSTVSSSIQVNGVSLSKTESDEIDKYIGIFREQGFTKHTDVNNYITGNSLWNEFKTIRSLNDHGKYHDIEGIEPKYFEIICSVLKISGEGGSPLDSYKKY
ncbi:MAG: hypothetical protein ACQEXC_08390 [Pseudomonadota bacterium]